MTRKKFSKSEKLRLFKLHGGVCHLCHLPIDPGQVWDIDHDIEVGLTGDNSDENCMPAHRRCHARKTATSSIPIVAKAKRREAKHIGVQMPKKKIRTRGFDLTPKPAPKRHLPPRQLYRRKT